MQPYPHINTVKLNTAEYTPYPTGAEYCMFEQYAKTTGQVNCCAPAALAFALTALHAQQDGGEQNAAEIGYWRNVMTTFERVDSVLQRLGLRSNRRSGTHSWDTAARRHLNLQLREIEDLHVRRNVRRAWHARHYLRNDRVYLIHYRGHVGALVFGRWVDWAGKSSLPNRRNNPRVKHIYEASLTDATAPADTAAQCSTTIGNTGATAMSELSKFYSNRTNALRAARSKTGLGPNAVVGEHFELVPHDTLTGVFAWRKLKDVAAKRATKKEPAEKKPRAKKAAGAKRTGKQTALVEPTKGIRFTVFTIADRVHKKHSSVKGLRAAVIAACTAEGISTGTSSSAFQKWRTLRKVPPAHVSE